jgi:hypothetical protein
VTAPDHLEPYAVHLRLLPQKGTIERPQELIAALLEETARGCSAAGATLIGHVKCHVRSPSGERFHANLTSVRHGARLGGETALRAPSLEVDLVALVYGLPRQEVEQAVSTALQTVAGKAAIAWSHEGPGHGHCEGDHGRHEEQD